MGVKGWILDTSLHMPSGNPGIGPAEIVGIELLVEIVPQEANTTTKIFSVDFIKFSVVRQFSHSKQRVKMDIARDPAVVNRIAFKQ